MSDDIVIERNQDSVAEDGVIVPLERINTDTLQRLVEELVTREWSSLSDEGFTLDGKVEQVLQQLKEGKALVVFDVLSETCNIVAVENVGRDKRA